MYETPCTQYAMVTWTGLLGDSADTGFKDLPVLAEDQESLDRILEGFERWRSQGTWSKLLQMLEHPTLNTCQCKHQHRPAEMATEAIKDLVYFKARLTIEMPVSEY